MLPLYKISRQQAEKVMYLLKAKHSKSQPMDNVGYFYCSFEGSIGIEYSVSVKKFPSGHCTYANKVRLTMDDEEPWLEIVWFTESTIEEVEESEYYITQCRRNCRWEKALDRAYQEEKKKNT